MRTGIMEETISQESAVLFRSARLVVEETQKCVPTESNFRV